jgi:hypothetical protein
MENTIKRKHVLQIAAVLLVTIFAVFISTRLVILAVLLLIGLRIANSENEFTKKVQHEILSALNTCYIALVAMWRKLRSQKPVVQSAFGVGLLFVVVGMGWYYFTGPKTTQADPVVLGTLPYPVGADRTTMNDQQRSLRVAKMVQTRQFYLLREDGAVEGAKKVTGEHYAAAIKGAAAKYGIEAEILEAHVYLESFGSEKAKSPTGPVGPGQFAVLTAANLWDVKDGRYLLRYKGQEKDVARNRRRTTRIRPEEITEDNRMDVELSVYAEAKLLKEEKDFFGRQDFASAAYHSSRDKIRRWVMTFLSPQPVTNGGKRDIRPDAPDGLTYDKLYFGATPYKNPGSYQTYRDLMAVDWGANYWYKVLCAKDLLAMYRENHFTFEDLANKQKYKGKRASNRMWTFYGADDEQLVSLDDLRAKLTDGELVTVPNDPRFGFKLRLEGADAIAAMDKSNQEYYIATKKETAGALLFIAQEVAKLRKDRKQLPLEVTSISRTVDYQRKLTKVNPVATKAVSFHVLGLAFDITKNGMSETDQRDIQFILDELDSTGYISWVPENAAYHVVVAPDQEAIAFFQSVYESTKTYRAVDPLVVQ